MNACCHSVEPLALFKLWNSGFCWRWPCKHLQIALKTRTRDFNGTHSMKRQRLLSKLLMVVTEWLHTCGKFLVTYWNAASGVTGKMAKHCIVNQQNAGNCWTFHCIYIHSYDVYKFMQLVTQTSTSKRPVKNFSSLSVAKIGYY